MQIKRRTCPEEVPDGFFCVMGGCEGRLGRGRAAPIKYSVFPCAEHSDEPPKSRNRVRQWASRFPEFHLHCTKRNTPYLIGAALTLPPNNIFHTKFHNTEEAAFLLFSGCVCCVCLLWMGGRTYNTGRGVLGLGRAALFLQMELSERSEFSICRNENSRQTQPRKLPVWRCGPPALPNLTNIPE